MASQASQPPSGMAKPSDPTRKKYDPKKPHITEEPITRSNWYKHVNWLNVTLIVGVPIYGLIAAYWTPLQLKTAIWAVAYYFMTGLGITAGMFYFYFYVLGVFTCKRYSLEPLLIDISYRLPQTLGTLLLLRQHPLEDLPCCSGRWSSRGFNPVVVERSPGPSQIYRH
jgi:hypothetical protein